MNKHFQDVEEVVCAGIRVPFIPNVITPRIERPMRNGRYEAGEIAAVRELVRPGDRVLAFGAGLGLVACAAAKVIGGANVTVVEANPELVPIIREVQRRNGISDLDLRSGLVASKGADRAPFYLRRDFWASSIERDPRPFERTLDIPVHAAGDLLKEVRPTVLVCDIAGAERDLFAHASLDGVRAIIIELHPKVYGEQGTAEVLADLRRAGFVLDPSNAGSSLRTLVRDANFPSDKANPRVLVSTCMKDEGPFILEWLAWHKSIGVTDFVVFTNDCGDGTDSLLDRLDELGELTHLPNPAISTGSTYYQLSALRFVQAMREFRRADFFISMDVDEFINVRLRDGHLRHLFAEAGYFDALSMSEINHGCNGRIEFERGLVTEQFPRHLTEMPGPRRRHNGVKTIVRRSARIANYRNHRPDIAENVGDPVWLNGSGRLTDVFLKDEGANGHNVRGTYDLVSLDHFALRSAHSFLVKISRGDVVIAGKRPSQRYWRVRNREDDLTSTFERQQPAFRREYERLIADEETSRLHAAACDAHESRIAELLELPEYIDWKRHILENLEKNEEAQESADAVA